MQEPLLVIKQPAPDNKTVGRKLLRNIMSEETKKEHIPYVGFPNELANDDPGSFHQSEAIKFTPPEPDGSDVYNRINFLIKLNDRMEMIEDRFKQNQRQRTMFRVFDNKPGIACGKVRIRLNPFRTETDNNSDESDEATKRLERLLWWRNLPDLGVSDIAEYDQVSEYELATGQWDT